MDGLAHLPRLRGLIVEPTESFYRNLDLAEIDAKVKSVGGPDDWRNPDEVPETRRRAFLEAHSGGDLWVFAYGSLIWDPAFIFSDARSARARDHQRRFCLRTELGRGTRETPGLMAALDAGSGCQGVAFKIDADRVEEETRVIFRREMLLPAYEPTFVVLETELGAVDALAFVIDREVESYAGELSFEETAQMIATGRGFLGTSLAYLDNLMRCFDALGIQDEELATLLRRARALAG
jgi:cation transport protein ChaC